MKPSRSRHWAQTLVAVLALASLSLTWATSVSAQASGGDPSLAPSATIQAVRYHVEPGQTRVWFETTGAVLYTHYSPDPLTLVIDLPGVDISAVAPRTVVGSREVESVSATALEGLSGKRLSRVEIKLATMVPYQLSGSEQALNVVFDGSDVDTNDVSALPQALPEPEVVTPIPRDRTIESPVGVVKNPPPPIPSMPEVSEPISVAKLPAHPASAISSVTYQMTNDGVLKVSVGANGRLNYTSFRLDSPRRLVFDFNGVLNAVARAAVPIESTGVDRARIAQFRTSDPRITRIVFDLTGEIAHRAVENSSGLEIQFAPSREQLFSATPLAAIQDEASLGTEPSPEPGDSYSEDPGQPSASMITISSNGEQVEPVGGPDATSSTGSTSEDTALIEPQTVTAQQLPFGSEPPDRGPALPAPPPEPAVVQAVGGNPSGQDVGSTDELGQKAYTGELISLDFKDGDIQDIFRLFADISGLNIVVQPGVSGRITLKLTEVPWDQALELILKTNKLGYIVDGNVIRIAPLAELANEEAERRRLAEEKALAGDLFTENRVLSYAKASELQPLIQRNLSARGDVVTDERTNTVIYTDLAERITAIQQLIETLDTPIPGVEIESRIIVTTRTFSRSFGIQWGFTGNAIPEIGNTTELVFPNRVQVGGQAIGSNANREFTVPGATTGGLLPPQAFDADATLVQRGYAVNLPFAGAPTGAVGISLGSIAGAFNIDAALSAAETRGQVRIISAPKIITQNNKPAEIKQGVTFPVQVVANNTITVQFKDAVLDLNVTPQITSADTIILDIQVNNDALDFGQAVNGIPSIVTQSATTQVLVPDGSTTVIGGVFVNRQDTNERYVPLLHRIPILGYLFKSKDNSTRNEELLIFLTPRIRKDTV